MIDMPESDVIQKIVEQKGHTEEEVREMIKEKLKQLSGLISEDGAAHIVANDLGVKLYKTAGTMKIKDVTLNAKQATIVGKVLQKYEVRDFDKNGRKGRVANMIVGDDSGRTRIVFWNDQVAIFEQLKQDDVVQISNPYVKENNGRIELHLNDKSNVDINPQGVSVTVPDRPAAPERQEREMKYLRDLQGGEDNIEVLGTIVQIYDPRFFPVDPETNRRVSDEDVAAGKPHVWNYVTTVFLDDGTANVRTTFWKNQTQHLFGLSDEEIVKWKDDGSLAQDPKHELLGEIIKIVGRCKKNDQFDRIELTANIVIKDVDPEAELKKIESQAAPASEPAPQPAPEPTPEPAAVKETTPPVETPAPEPVPTTQEDREVKPEDVAFDTADKVEEPAPAPEPAAQESEKPEEKKSDGLAIKEDVISIDDLEDL